MLRIIKILPKRIFLLFTLDVVILFSLIIGLFVFLLDKSTPFYQVAYSWFFILIPITFVGFLYAFRGYDLKKIQYSQKVLDSLIKVTITNLFLWGAILFLVPDVVFSRKVLLSFSALAPVVILIWRYLFIFMLGKKALVERILIVGSGELTSEIVGLLRANSAIGYKIISVIYIGKCPEFSNIECVEYKKGLLKDLVADSNINKIVLSVKGDVSHGLVKELVNINQSKAKIVSIDDFYATVTGRVPLSYLEKDVNFIACLEPANLYYRTWEFLFNFIASLFIFVIAVPLFIVIPVLIKILSPGPVFYVQNRVGRGGKEFNFYKFRTMIVGDHKGMATDKEDVRITGIGKFLRSTHLDELPQLLNVLKRDMNIIGPRPEQPEFAQDFAHKIPFYEERYLVRPGVTGWAQVKQGYGFEETDMKLAYDIYYTKYRSITLDLIILIKTFEEVFSGKAR